MVGESRTLILTLTRRCNLRCGYCPTVKDGWPDLSPEDARRAIQWFARSVGGGEVKLFGGEPTLVPDAVETALDAAEEEPRIRRIQLSTNTLGLDDRWVDRLAARRKLVVAMSLDGHATDHNRLRRALDTTTDPHASTLHWACRLRGRLPLLATQVIAPATASRAALNFEAVLGAGFHTVNLLPAYYVPWRDDQLAALGEGLDRIAATIEARWDAGEPLYLRNLTVRAPIPFFNSGAVVDVDGSIHPANVALAGSLAGLHDEFRLGSLDDPPSVDALERAVPAVVDRLRATLPAATWASTLAVDALLGQVVRRLLPRWLRRRAAASGASGASAEA